MNNISSNNKKIKVNIAAAHRFHLLDLARELDAQGFDVRFYSYVPNKRCRRYGLPKECCASFFWLLFPFLVLQKILGSKTIIIKYRNLVMDYYLSWFMRRCDVYIALGTVYKYSFIAAKRKFSAKTILEWGSKHIDAQQEILAKCNGALTAEYFNQRSRDGYEIADYIAIPSIHAQNSFIKHGILSQKLIINPYGVNTSMFSSCNQKNKIYDLIMVGGWSLRKGCDLIIEAVRKTGLRFLHVGGIVDLEFPKDDNFTHIDPVDEFELQKYYHMAKVFVFPSREDGFGMVLSQALVCNLPIVGSPDCGAPDLKRMVDFPDFITIIRDYSVDAVCDAIREALNNYEKLGDKVYAGKSMHLLTWESYGKRYKDNIDTIISQ